MTKFETNRMIVQRGLTLRAAKRREEAAKKAEAAREAALDAAEDAMHREINFMSKWQQIENEISRAAQQSVEESRERRAAIRAREEKKAEQLRIFIRRSFATLGVSLTLLLLCKVDALAVWAAKGGMLLAGLFCVANYVAYTARNWKWRAE